ncbi:MAG: cysteine-rich CWC family protein [Oxalobacteraceae bacterium]|nr:cysteine-rich CWC family protein [Oxalobacteraceae bacterium]
MSTCMRCGARFACGMVDGHNQAPCWCSSLPALPAAAIGATSDAGAPSSCLCPACLRATVATLAPPPAALR